MAILKTLIVKGVARFLTDAYMSTIKSGIWNGSTIQVGYGGTGVTSAKGDLYTPVFLSSSGITPCTVAIPHNTKDFKINGTTYSIFTTYTGTAPTIFAPTALAGTGGYILATKSDKSGLEWVAKPASNVTTSAVVSNSALGTTLISAAQSDPYYNLLEGGTVARSIQFKHGDDLSISSSTGGIITFSLPTRLKALITSDTGTTIFNGFGRITSDGPFEGFHTSAKDCMIVSTGYSSTWGGLLALDYRTNNIAYRAYNNGTWTDWALIASNRNVVNDNTTVSWNTETTIATIAGIPIKIKIPSNPNTNTWRGIYTSGTSRVGTATNTKAMNFASTNLTIGYLAAGTGSGQSGSADYFTIDIEAKNWTGATSSAAGTAGYMPGATSANRLKFLRGDGTWVELIASGSLNPSISNGSTTNTVKITVDGEDSSDYTIPYATHSSTTDFFKAYELASGTDINTATTNKYYVQSGTNACAAMVHGPSGRTNGEMYLLNIRCGSNYGQLLYYSRGNTNWQWWTRTFSGTSFSDWVQIVHSGNVSNKDATIGTSLTEIATIAGVSIKAKIGSYLPSNHVYPLSIAADSGTNQLSLVASTKYKLTAGGSTFIFTTPDNGVRSVTINGKYLRVNTNGTNADLTIPYATTTSVLASSLITTETTITESGVRAYTGSGSDWEGDITSMAYAAILTFGDPSRGWQMWARRASNPGMYWRRGNSDATAWEDPRLFLDSVNTSASVSGNTLTLTIGGSNTTFTPSLANLVVQIFNSTKTLKVSEWTTIAAVNTYDAGTYALLISSGTTLYASGIFSLCKNTDATNDEIPLHVSSTSNAWRPYARISGNNLLMSSTEATGTSRSYTVKIFKLI